MKFTQQIRDNWLQDLKSGESIQLFEDYMKGNNERCCIAVLQDVTLRRMEMDITRGFDMLSDLDPNGYFLSNLIRTNDYINKPEARDYSNVIPLIEALPVQD